MIYRRHLISLIFILTFSIHTLTAQLSNKYEGYKEAHYKKMRYGLFKPANYDRGRSYPLIVYLHGSRDTVSRDISWYQESIQTKTPCFVLTPKCEESDQGWGNTWQGGHTAATAKTLALVDSLATNYNIDKNRLYLYGISMGGFGVFSILAKEKGTFAAGYAVCGGSNATAAEKLLTVPLWIFHGEKDDVVPVSLSRDVYKEIVRLGGKTVRYTEYPGVKHNSWENVTQEKSLGKWLFAQRKGQATEPPDPVMNVAIEVQNNPGVKLKWSKPTNQSKAGKEVWYYKLFRDDTVLAELDGDVSTYTDSAIVKNTHHRYYLVAVNYFFKESRASEKVIIK